MKKIQVVKKGTPRAGADGAICPYFLDVPFEPKK
jgi:hypothetical protein